VIFRIPPKASKKGWDGIPAKNGFKFKDMVFKLKVKFAVFKMEKSFAHSDSS